MLYQMESQQITLDVVELGLKDLEESLGELMRLCDAAGEEYDVNGRELSGLMRMLQCVAHVQRQNVQYLLGESLRKGKVKAV